MSNGNTTTYVQSECQYHSLKKIVKVIGNGYVHLKKQILLLEKHMQSFGVS